MKSQISTNLMDGEEIRYQTKLHWICYLRTVPLFFMAIIVLIAGPSLAEGYGITSIVFSFIGSLILLAGIAYSVYLHLLIRTSEFAVTNKRFFMKRGILSKRIFEIFHTKTESLSIEQSLMGRIFKYGTVIIGGTGGSKEEFAAIQNSSEFRKTAQEEINKAQSA